MNNTFSVQYKATIGTDFLTKELEQDHRILTLQVWDTAGQEKYHSLQGVFYKGADACLIVFDITSPDSFADIERWHAEFISHGAISDPDNFPFILIGNKADLASRRKVCAECGTIW